MKYQKYITVMQMAMGVTASNKDCLPTKRQLWGRHGPATPDDIPIRPAGRRVMVPPGGRSNITSLS
ncbi:hypothetical protein CRUP_017444 [Coryphaenoides rupestris]|nr:hypothetical protein CRUP_017444 [Coryphaenoides rupestris]